MELSFLSCTVFFVVSVLSLLYAFCKTSQNAATTKLPLPPGKTGWPYIGETLEYLSAARKGVLEKFFADRRRRHFTNVFKTSLFGEPMAILCGAEGNKFIFSNENKLVQSWWPSSVQKLLPSSENTTSTEGSKRLRKILITGFLKTDVLQSKIGVMDAVTRQHLQMHWNCEAVKVHALMKFYTFTLACRLFLSIEDLDIVVKLQKPFNKVVPGFISLPINLPGTTLNRAIRASNELRKEIQVMIKQRKIDISKQGLTVAQDILSQMLLAKDENGEFLNEWDIANNIVGLLIGAHDTTSVALVSIINYLAELPDIYDGVLREQAEIANSKGPEELLNWKDIQKMTFSWNVAKEALRVLPPLQGTFREVITDFTYQGFLIPKGLKLHWNAFATHKDPEYFPDPERFDPSRFEGNGPTPYAYVPFGGGPRMCPGREFARLEILIFMHNVVTKFKWAKVFPEEKVVLDPIPRPIRGLPIRLYPHTS